MQDISLLAAWQQKQLHNSVNTLHQDELVVRGGSDGLHRKLYLKKGQGNTIIPLGAETDNHPSSHGLLLEKEGDEHI